MKDLHRMRRLLWVYFWFLLFEGALRKWVFRGGVGNALLSVRDLIVLLMYLYAWKVNLFPRNILVIFGVFIALVTFVVSCIMPDANIIIAIFGARTNFFYIPFIFLIPKIIDKKHVEEFGYWILIMSIPMTLIMVAQFVSPATSAINAAVGEGGQYDAALGHIRPAGTFSFNSGPTFFYSFAAVFLIHSQFSVGRYPAWLCIFSAFSLAIAVAVSSSRSLLSSVLIVCFFALITFAVRMQLKARWVFISSGLVVGLFSLMMLPVVQEGVNVFMSRIDTANQHEASSGGFFSRALKNFTAVEDAIAGVPALGYGLGKGTNFAAVILTGKAQFLSEFAEIEWQRIVFESGPAIGGAFILYRIAITCWMASIVIPFVKRKDPLPFLLFGSCFLGILNGQLAFSTNLGFIMFLCGLCLAATKSA
jgi:hypothetical protein